MTLASRRKTPVATWSRIPVITIMILSIKAQAIIKAKRVDAKEGRSRPMILQVKTNPMNLYLIKSLQILKMMTRQNIQIFPRIQNIADNADKAKYPARDMPAINKFGKDSRYYPSPYKSFVPFTGNPVPRQFPHPPGHRPYYQGQARGRRKLWGVGQTFGRRQVTARNFTLQKKREH